MRVNAHAPSFKTISYEMHWKYREANTAGSNGTKRTRFKISTNDKSMGEYICVCVYADAES